MAKNLRTSLKESIKASSKAGLIGSNVFGSSPLDLRFAQLKTLDPRITFTRASSGTYVGADGLVKTATTNEARFDHNPTTGESLGLLVEEARTNLLLNSATLSTQSVTVAAAANTLSFYGTGTVTLTGVSTAGPLVGTGANNRVSLTFTPTAGVLVLTVSGSVTNAQLEAGAFATSYISTTTTTVTRAADVASITGANFSSWYNQMQGTVYMDSNSVSVTPAGRLVSFSDNTSSNRIILNRSAASGGNINLVVTNSGTVQVNALLLGTALAGGTSNKVAAVYKATDFAGSVNGLTAVTQGTGTVPSAVTQLSIGNGDILGANTMTGTIKRLTYWPVRLANPTLQSITTP